jgi:hypothetical protein
LASPRSTGAALRQNRTDEGEEMPRKHLLLGALALALLVAPFAIAQGGNRQGGPIILGERNPSGTQGSGSTAETAIIADIGSNGQATRQSNNAPGGRAAGYGCQNDGTAVTNACANYVNRGQGPAAAFRTRGNIPFLVDDNTGKVPNLNADMLDDQTAADFVAKTEQLFAQVRGSATAATLEDQRGATAATRAGTGDYRVDFGSSDVSKCAYAVTPANNAQSRIASADVLGGDNTQVQVQLRDDAGAAAEGDFSLTVTC